ncbi:arylamine N-acetyltransferase family protein [Streptomyces profundus]|uniref:arylamine N-acetyltransferase family protein n=1 Tax=Streptomyces profundus TaxID=2867410 RepID=UPI001D161724|nr:arylamine N-acetyltransferase [Streptomyces sp. MA3_2.13]UED87512.1 arylamine N-acetyltransferase [Streptomyces sp. MA3_2.13]
MSYEKQFDFDITAYLHRIGWRAEPAADLATLRGVHRAHLLSIPFENLDALRGTAPSLEVDDLVAKLVHGRRGGYCFEQNTLLAAALEALGFEVTLLTGWVALGAEELTSRPRSHQLLLVGVPGDPEHHLADVGFGAAGGLLEPVPLVADVEFRTDRRLHRLVHAPRPGPLPLWQLEARTGDSWQPQVGFTLEPFEPVHMVTQNWYVATHPRSPFAQRLYAQRTLADHHLAVDGRQLVETGADGTVSVRELADEAEVRLVLDERFGIAVPEGTPLSG